MRREYIKETGDKIEEMWECEWWEIFKTNDKIKNHVRTHFPCKRLLSTDCLIAKVKSWIHFGYVQCDLVVPDELKSKYNNFAPIFKMTEVGRNDIKDSMKNYELDWDVHPCQKTKLQRLFLALTSVLDRMKRYCFALRRSLWAIGGIKIQSKNNIYSWEGGSWRKLSLN